jgi:hypothetical protein
MFSGGSRAQTSSRAAILKHSWPVRISLAARFRDLWNVNFVHSSSVGLQSSVFCARTAQTHFQSLPLRPNPLCGRRKIDQMGSDIVRVLRERRCPAADLHLYSLRLDAWAGRARKRIPMKVFWAALIVAVVIVLGLLVRLLRSENPASPRKS